MIQTFLDTSFFKAILDPKDEFSQKGILLQEQFIAEKSPMTTTNYIVDETLTLLRSRCGKEKAFGLREFISREDLYLDIIRVTIEDEQAAWNWFEKEWSKLSYTDCVSFAVMKRLGIQHVATFDHHFAQAGFTILKA